MRINCPNCDTLVEFDDGGLPEKRRPVRCPNCNESWFTGGKTDLYALSFNKPSEIDPEVARILQEEAQREMAARKEEEEDWTTPPADRPDSKTNHNSAPTPKNLEPIEDDYVPLSWKQRALVVFLCLIAILAGTYIFAPKIISAFPNLADWITSYIFWINDMLNKVSGIIENAKMFYINLNLGGLLDSLLGSVIIIIQSIIDFVKDLISIIPTGLVE